MVESIVKKLVVELCMAVVTPVTLLTNRRGGFAQADTNRPIRSRHRGGAGYQSRLKHLTALEETLGCNVNDHLGEFLQGLLFD